MFYKSLFVSIVLLVLVNLLVTRTKYPATVAIGLCCLGLVACPVLFITFPPPVTWQTGLMCVLLVVLLVPRWGRRLYLASSCVATLVAYSIFFRSLHEKREVWAELKHEFPYETLVDRLPPRMAMNTSPPSDLGRLDKLESEIQRKEYDVAGHYWSEALHDLHENSVDEFVNRPGFGFGRIMSNDQVVSEIKTFRNIVHDRSPVRQPDYLNPFTPPSKKHISALQSWNTGEMFNIHDNGVLDFVNTNGLGYVKDREHVAGFQKHGMSKVPKGSTEWSVAHIDLVGLVVHEKPVVYITANLPQMDEVSSAPKRPLDSFELAGLETLREGEDLYYRGAGDKARMLGSIRCVKQCLACHGGSRGDLLGAFSYGLIRETPQP